MKTESHAETGYVLARDAWGKGYATEIIQAVVDAALRCSHIHELAAQCHADHVVSRHLLEKAGFVLQLEQHSSKAVFPNIGTDEPQPILCYVRQLNRSDAGKVSR